MTQKKQDNWNAEFYKKNAKTQHATGISMIRKIKFRGDDQVLDIGCGDGAITAEIAKLVPHGSVLGIDVSQNMLTDAQKSFADIKNLKFECTDAANFTYDKKFDLIVSFSAFHWVKDQQAALKNIYKALKPGGQLVIHMAAVHKTPGADVYASPKWAPFMSDEKSAYSPRTAQDFCAMLEDAGFNNIDINYEIIEIAYQDKQNVLDSAFAWVSSSTKLTETEAHEFAQDFLDSICNTRKDGKLILERARLNVYATKPVKK